MCTSLDFLPGQTKEASVLEEVELELETDGDDGGKEDDRLLRRTDQHVCTLEDTTQHRASATTGMEGDIAKIDAGGHYSDKE